MFYTPLQTVVGKEQEQRENREAKMREREKTGKMMNL